MRLSLNSVSKEIDLIIESNQDWRGEKLAEIRQAILSTSLEIVETVKWKMPSKPLGSACWERGGILCVANYLKNAVRLTFPKGALIDDPYGFYNSRLDSKTTRAIDYSEDSAIDVPALTAMLIKASEQNS